MASKSGNNKKSQRSPKPANKTRKQDQGPEAKAPVEPTNRPKGLTVVGIGASAGGLKPLQAFFESMPADTGMAFVVITHLHPEHESHMHELLQSKTQMRVSQVVSRVPIEPNHVYVIPPNRNIIVTDAQLDTAEFEEPRGHRTPVDAFFRSLARAHHGAIAIILSGGGTDGAVGIKDIKQDGGLLMVQHPQEAEYDSMPNAAIQTGLADVVLPVRELAEKLVDYSRHAPELPQDANDLTERELETIQRILAQVHARTGHDFNQYKRSTVLRRIQRRMQINGFATLEEYLGHMRTNASEAVAMFNDILINVTNFFRDREPWEALAAKIIPAIFADKAPDEMTRVWSIGCATGEEAFSLAILLLEHVSTLDRHYEFQVFASDLDESSLMRAREGLYPSAIEADVSAERLERFFTQEGNHYRVKRELRDSVLFTNHSILRDPPFSRLDLIACRNVLIYMQPHVQDNLFDIFQYALNPGGHLFLGSSESAERVPQLFEVVDKAHRIYHARPWRGERPHVPTLPISAGRAARSELRISPRPVIRQLVEQPFAVEEQHRRALESHAPPSMLVNEDYIILHISETAGRYLLQPKGPITTELLKLVRAELQLELRSALFQAFEKDKATISKPVPVQFNGHPRLVVLSVLPRRQEDGPGKAREKQALVLFLEEEFDERKVEGTGAQEEPEARDKARSNLLVTQLEAEVQRLRDKVQATVEEFDSTNEEMKAANEELQSINEEYRSATEELETSKEELQSLNEELQTVNNEMKSKLEEISRANSDLENLIDATKIATLFLDRDLNIRRFTPGMQELFNIMPSDYGRPIAHLTHKLGYTSLVEDAREVLDNLVIVEHEASAINGGWLLIRLRPYRTIDNRIDGVVITFVDITALKKADEYQRNMNVMLEEHIQERTRELGESNQNLSHAHDLFHALFHANPIPTALVHIEDGIFLDINPAYLDYMGYKREELVGHSWRELDLPVAPEMESALKTKLGKEGMIRDLELEIDHPSGERRTILASIQPIQLDGTNAVIGTFIDITERKRLEQQVRSAASNLTSSEQAERQRIARILHDDLQQNIFAVKMQLTFLAEAIERNDLEGLKLDLKQLDDWLAKAIQTTRQVSIDLSPPILHDEGLAEALIWLASQMKEQYGLDVMVQTDGASFTFEDDIRVLVFQSVRELLFNIVKHSGTLQALVTIGKFKAKARITVSDEGKGFDGEHVMGDRKVAHGLLRMRDRLYLLGCTLSVASKLNDGTRVTIEAPIKGIID